MGNIAAASIQGRPFPVHIISVADYQNVYFCERNRDSLHCILDNIYIVNYVVGYRSLRVPFKETLAYTSHIVELKNIYL